MSSLFLRYNFEIRLFYRAVERIPHTARKYRTSTDKHTFPKHVYESTIFNHVRNTRVCMLYRFRPYTVYMYMCHFQKIHVQYTNTVFLGQFHVQNTLIFENFPKNWNKVLEISAKRDNFISLSAQKTVLDRFSNLKLPEWLLVWIIHYVRPLQKTFFDKKIIDFIRYEFMILYMIVHDAQLSYTIYIYMYKYTYIYTYVLLKRMFLLFDCLLWTGCFL